jgi:hypothetical protein
MLSEWHMPLIFSLYFYTPLLIMSKTTAKKNYQWILSFSKTGAVTSTAYSVKDGQVGAYSLEECSALSRLKYSHPAPTFSSDEVEAAKQLREYEQFLKFKLYDTLR